MESCLPVAAEILGFASSFEALKLITLFGQFHAFLEAHFLDQFFFLVEFSFLVGDIAIMSLLGLLVLILSHTAFLSELFTCTLGLFQCRFI